MQLDTLLRSLASYGVVLAYFVLFSIIFAESGLLIGFFLPGDSLLFTAGFLASKGIFNIYLLAPLFVIAAIIGDSVGYVFGQRVGKKLFHKKDSFFFHKDNLIKAQEFYEKYGKKTIIISRFIPLIRTFAPIIAGIGDMHYETFLAYNIIGGILWSAGITLAGYFLGSLIPDVDKYLLPIIIGIIFVSVAPPIYHILKDPHHRKQILHSIKKILKIKE